MDSLLQSIELVRNQSKRKCVEAGPTVVKSNVRPPPPTLINQRTYPLNKSRTKFVTVGLCGYGNFAPVVQVNGLKNDWVVFDEVEWKSLLENQCGITNYFSQKDLQLAPINLNSFKRIAFQAIGSTKVIAIEDLNGFETYLGLESLAELWELIPIIEYQIVLLKSFEFSKFYSSIVKGVAAIPGDVKLNILDIISNLNITSDNVLCMLEMLKVGFQIVCVDVDFEQKNAQRVE